MNYPWVMIGKQDELEQNQMKQIQVDGKRLLLANAAGKYYVVDEMCSHEDYSLYLGCIKDRTIKCSLHGSYFDLETGEPTEEPACEAIHTYQVILSEGKIWLNPG